MFGRLQRQEMHQLSFMNRMYYARKHEQEEMHLMLEMHSS